MKGYMCIVCSHFNVSLRLPCLHYVTVALPLEQLYLQFGPMNIWSERWKVDHIKRGILDGFCVVLILRISRLKICHKLWCISFSKCHEGCHVWEMSSSSMAWVSIIRRKTSCRGCRFIPCILGHVQYRCLHSTS